MLKENMENNKNRFITLAQSTGSSNLADFWTKMSQSEGHIFFFYKKLHPMRK